MAWARHPKGRRPWRRPGSTLARDLRFEISGLREVGEVRMYRKAPLWRSEVRGSLDGK
jgi:hypothetical protein